MYMFQAPVSSVSFYCVQCQRLPKVGFQFVNFKYSGMTKGNIAYSENSFK